MFHQVSSIIVRSRKVLTNADKKQGNPLVSSLVHMVYLYLQWMDDDLKITGKNTEARGKLRIFYLPQHSIYGGLVVVQA